VRVETIAESLYRLDVVMPGGRYLFTVYLVNEGKGVLIEPGPASIIPSILEGMKQLGMKGLSHIIPTHIHMDHGGGSGALAALFPHSKVVVHPRALKHMLDPSRLIEGTQKAYGDDFETQYGPIRPVPESQLTVPIDGETLSIDGRELQIIYAPGHAPHQIAVFDKKTGGLFCGEALGVPIPGEEGFALPAISVTDFDPDLYLETIEKLKQLNPRVLYYSHQGGIQNPDRLINNLDRNIRLLRQGTLEGLKRGETVEEIEKRLDEILPGFPWRKRELMDLGQETILGMVTYFRRKGLPEKKNNHSFFPAQ
jgi:glyoxylase-like metal-dependent hydrolase (beta-lactamase superfamily II)